jgi:hypothetical protein
MLYNIAILLALVAAVDAVGSCTYQGRKGECLSRSECPTSSAWVSYTQTSDRGCLPYPSVSQRKEKRKEKKKAKI